MWEARRISGLLEKPQVLDNRSPASVLMRTHPSFTHAFLPTLQEVPLAALLRFLSLLVANLLTHHLPLPLKGLPWDELPKVPQK